MSAATAAVRQHVADWDPEKLVGVVESRHPHRGEQLEVVRTGQAKLRRSIRAGPLATRVLASGASAAGSSPRCAAARTCNPLLMLSRAARTKSMTSKGAKGLRKLLSDAFGASQHNIHSSGLSAGLPPPVPQLPMSFQGGYSQAQAPPQWSPPEWVEYGPPPTATLPPYGGPPIATLARRLSLARAQRFFVLPDTGETIFVDDVVENGRWVGYAYWDRVRSQWCGWW